MVGDDNPRGNCYGLLSEECGSSIDCGKVHAAFLCGPELEVDNFGSDDGISINISFLASNKAVR